MQGFSLNGFTSGRIDGSGNLSVNVVPEPFSLLLLGSGDKEHRMVGAGFLESSRPFVSILQRIRSGQRH